MKAFWWLLVIWVISVGGCISSTRKSGWTDHPKLENTHWVLTAIKGRPANDSGRQSYIELQPKLVRFIGDTGINTISGTYSKTDHELRFTIETRGQAGGSDEAVAQDRDLAFVLGSTQAYRLEGRELSLMVDGQVAALFVAK